MVSDLKRDTLAALRARLGTTYAPNARLRYYGDKAANRIEQAIAELELAIAALNDLEPIVDDVDGTLDDVVTALEEFLAQLDAGDAVDALRHLRPRDGAGAST